MTHYADNHRQRHSTETVFRNILILLLLFTGANAGSFYVSNSGSDSWAGTSPGVLDSGKLLNF